MHFIHKILADKLLQLLGTNPGRPDGEQTVRIRVKNIPLSVDDGLITRTIILKELDVNSEMREKLRVNDRLTNCERPRTMQFGKFIGRVFHFRQNKGLQEKKPVTASLTTEVSGVCSRYLYYLQF